MPFLLPTLLRLPSKPILLGTLGLSAASTSYLLYNNSNISTPFTLRTLLPQFSSPSPLALRCDSSPSRSPSPIDSYATEARVPVIKPDGSLNARALRQVSAGSIAGLLGGVAISVFSKPLAVIIGLGVWALQALESRGIHVVPYKMLQRTLGEVNARNLVRDNVAFKLSFGLAFALAAFAEF